MKRSILIFALFCLITSSTFPQKEGTSKNCSVILLNNQWIINSYDKGEKAVIHKNSEGILSVYETGDISKKSFKGEAIQFKIAIQRKADGTVFSYSENAFQSMEVGDILKECQPGDKIIVILQQSENYSLPHNQLEVL